MVEDLKKIGMIEHKTRRMVLPSLEPQYTSDFVRGFFDGDGCIFYNKRTRNWGSCFTSANKNFLMDLWLTLKHFTPIKTGSLRQRTGNAYELRFGEGDTIMLCNFMYKDKDFCLHRKRDKYFKMLEEVNQ